MESEKYYIIKNKNPEFLEEYGSVSIEFSADRIFEVVCDSGTETGYSLKYKECPAFRKNYDDDGSPARWREEWDIRNWGIFALYHGGILSGAVAVAVDTNGVNLLEGRRDLAYIWDIRIKSELRGMGFGSALFRQAALFAKERGCRELRVETQNINYGACMFYRRMGMALKEVNIGVYSEYPDEVQLIWSVKL